MSTTTEQFDNQVSAIMERCDSIAAVARLAIEGRGNVSGAELDAALELIEREAEAVSTLAANLPSYPAVPEPPKPAEPPKPTADVRPLRRKSQARVFADADGNGKNARLLPPIPADVEPEHAQ